MRVIHTICSLDADSGGPARSVPGLCGGLVQSGVDLSVAVTSGSDGVEESIRSQPYVNFYDGVDYRGYLRNVFERKQPDIIHDHAIWSMRNHAVCSLAEKHRIPFMIAPRGMLEPWSLNEKKWKKKLAMLLYQRRNLSAAAALHATAESEANHLQKLGFRQPIIVSPNGVTLPDVMPAKNMRRDGKKVLLFISRIHPKKGILELVEAWAKLRNIDMANNMTDQWHIEYAGPDYGDHLKVVANEIRARGLEQDFTYLGVLDDVNKWRAYRRADIFVLPTYSENFGIVIAEALAAEVPAITTKGTPWSELQGTPNSQCCGWWIDLGVDALLEALVSAMSMDDAERATMGENGRKLVELQYSWASIAEDMKSAYEWLINGGSAPRCIWVD